MKITVAFCLMMGVLTCALSGCGTKSAAPPPTPPPTDTSTKPVVNSDVAFYLTKADKSVLMQQQQVTLAFGSPAAASAVITVDTTKTYQSIDGFGYCLTGGSAYLINRMTVTDRQHLLNELFLTDTNHIGVSYLRVSMGASDLSADVFSYDDSGSVASPDTNLVHFDLATDTTDLVPLLKQILTLAPTIKIVATPWSAPLWMKSNDNSVGGTLLPAYYEVYAQYFVKYIQAMAAQGITIDAVTPQNEPQNPSNNPSMSFSATQETDFIKNHLGPAFKAASLGTKIICWDHNADMASFPEAVLGDAEANPFVDGSAFHLYAGDISALSAVHNAFPTKNIYFTEQFVGGPGDFKGDLDWHVRNLIIGATRNWSRNVLEWNLASDESYYPHTAGGCTNCMGAVTIGELGSLVSRNTSYYVIAHASKFVRPGSVRVDSNVPGSLPNVAFVRPDGKKVLIVLNDSGNTQTFNIQFKSKAVQVSMTAGAVGTFVW